MGKKPQEKYSVNELMAKQNRSFLQLQTVYQCFEINIIVNNVTGNMDECMQQLVNGFKNSKNIGKVKIVLP